MNNKEEIITMKINKILTEDIDELAIDPADSVAEIADTVQDQVNADVDNGVGLSDTSAEKVAVEIKDVGTELEVEDAIVIDDVEAIGTDNKITRLLEHAFQKAKKNARRGGKANNNILICGLPGSGKTASVYEWAKQHAGGVNIFYLNAKNRDLDAYINGYTVRDFEQPMSVGQAFSSNLDKLDEPNSVLFLDEYNRQTKPEIRAALLTLINEHTIVGKGKAGTKKFDNLLFTIACINPTVPTDKGAAALNDAELSRFIHKIKNADSDPAATVDFFTKNFDKSISKLDPEDAAYLEDLEDYLRIQDLGLFIAAHPDFEYDTMQDLDDLFMEQKTMLNQRELTDALVASDGDKDAFIWWLDDYSDLLDRKKDMLHAILSEYIEPSFEDLCSAKGIDPNSGAIADQLKAKAEAEAEAEAAATEEPELPEEEIEDDEELFANAGTTTSTRVKSPQEVIDAIKAAAANW